VESVAGKVPVVLAVNKKDLVDEAAYRAEDIQAVANRIVCPHLMTSAKTGENVEVVFRALGARVAQRQLQIA